MIHASPFLTLALLFALALAAAGDGDALAAAPVPGSPADPANARAKAMLDAIPATVGVPHVYRTVGERQLRLWVYDADTARAADSTTKPATKPATQPAPRPAILFVHGGGWVHGTPTLFELHARHFAARGMVAVTIEYRLTSLPGVSVFDCVADTKAAVRWVRSHAIELGVDPKRVAIAGDSAGGHLAACAAYIPGLEAEGQDLNVTSRPDAVILYNPIVDTVPPQGWDLARFGGPGGKLAAPRARELSPIHHVQRGDPPGPPALLLHGVADTVTPIANTDRFVTALKERGDKPSYFRLEGQNHAFVLRGYGSDFVVAASIAETDGFLQKLGYLPPPQTRVERLESR
ncbi:MAG: alpha/beta hydrolase [Planctomycetota bacterium]|nr:alpha/beta hydrolase [Planctomycetota bacterium]